MSALRRAPSLRDPGLARMALFVLLALWLLYPFVARDKDAQDAIPLVVAGELVAHHADDIYVDSGGSLYDTKPAFHDASCRYYEHDSCDDYAVAFVSPPAALPVVVPLSWLGSAAFPVLRELGALSLVAAMALLWWRLRAVSARAEVALAATALCLTPLVTTPLDLGQTSPLLFLAAAAPISVVAGSRARSGLFSVLLALVTALKAFPLALLAIPALHRRWRVVVWPLVGVGVLAVLSLLVAPAHLWHDFLTGSAAVSRGVNDNPYSSSIESALGQHGIDSGALAWALRAALAVPIVVVLRRVVDVDVRWGASWAAALVLFPQVWAHYSFVSVAAITAVLVSRADRERWLWALPAVAATTIPVGLLAGSGHGNPTVQLAMNVLALAITLAVAAAPGAGTATVGP